VLDKRTVQGVELTGFGVCVLVGVFQILVGLGTID
jgi:hypothetical protein